MAYDRFGRKLRKIGVVGSGQIGPDIALHFTKVFASYDVPVVVVDVAEEALERGRAKIEKKVAKGVETGAFEPGEAARMTGNVRWTSDYAELAGADLVIEAATENENLKRKIFAQLESVCGPDAILASNSSHLEPERIAGEIERRHRGLVIHYFFPAERNLVVEVVPASFTAPEIVAYMMRLYEEIGKVPIRVESRYGYAIDPIFEGIFQAAALCVEEGMGSVKEVDAAAARALGLGVGPFTAMNLTGGNPITAVGLDCYHDKIQPWFRTPEILKRQLDSGAPWETAGRGETVDLPEERERTIADAMRGAYFGLAGEILDSGIASLGDLETAVELALAIDPPCARMDRIGHADALHLVERYAETHPGFKIPESVRAWAASGEPWNVPWILREDADGVAVLVIRRPKVLNALNDAVFEQLRERIREVGADDSVRAVVITGFGKKAFVSGADVGFLAGITSPEEGEKTSLASQSVLNEIAACTKPVVCAMNGLAFGGGNELAMACHVRIARAGLRVLAGQPEVNLGILPGAGATQRLPRIVGFEAAWRMLRTGRPISSDEALRIGLVRELVSGDLRARAVKLTRDLADGKESFEPIPDGPLDVPGDLPEVDLGHLSTAIDALLQKAILEGAGMPLADGLAHEALCFGEVFRTRDARIGIRNFLENGPRARAAFVHA